MEFPIDGQNYRSSKLDPKQQFHIARRLMPLLEALRDGAQDVKPNASGEAPEVAESPADGADDPIIKKLVASVADMSQQDCDYILDTCLSVVSRQQGNAWVKVYNDRAKAFQFADIGLQTMLAIAQNVIEENLGGFFGESNVDKALGQT